MKIRTKINISFFITFILVISLIGLVVGFYTINSIKENIGFYLLVFFIVGLVFLLVELLIFQKITKSVEILITDIERVEQGDFDYKININTKDEIGILANRESQIEIENKVKEQTGEIRIKAQELENQQSAILNILEDLEEDKHHIAKEKDKMDAILHSIGDGVFVVDKNLKVILINRVAAKMAGYKMEEILNTKYNDKLKFIFENTGEINDQFINKVIETRTIQEMSNHTALINKNGSKIPVADSAAPLLNAGGKIIGCVVVFRDVTKEREVDKAKTEFVSLASHQLRTPLSAINWYTEMLMAGDAGDMNEEQKKYLGEVVAGSKRMVDLVNAFLNVSRLDLGTFIVEPEPTNVVEMVKSVVNELKPQIIEKKLKIEELYGENIPEFQADKKLLRMIFQNLLSNAIKYTSSEGLVKIELLVALKGQNFGGKNITEDSITIKISDTGMGIPDKQKDKIFLKLFRADNVREIETEGTGLGLYIVKSIIDHSEGLIWFKSEENKGTTFYIVFPLSGMKKKEDTKKLD